MYAWQVQEVSIYYLFFFNWIKILFISKTIWKRHKFQEPGKFSYQHKADPVKEFILQQNYITILQYKILNIQTYDYLFQQHYN